MIKFTIRHFKHCKRLCIVSALVSSILPKFHNHVFYINFGIYEKVNSTFLYDFDRRNMSTELAAAIHLLL